MLKEVKMYTVVCDNCGKDVNKNAEYSAWNDKIFAEEVAMEESEEVLQVENNGFISTIERLENLSKLIPYKGQINKAIVETYYHAITIIKEEFAEPPKH